MKTLCLIFLFIPFNFFGQEVYYSFLTETYPNIYRAEFKWVDRRIVFEPNDVTIVTETKRGKDIEVLNIQETQVVDDRLILSCKNRSKRKITIVFPKEKEEFLYIDYYYRSLTTNEEIQVRLHIEGMQTERMEFFQN
jgi:ribosomal silencing factor RsfS